MAGGRQPGKVCSRAWLWKWSRRVGLEPGAVLLWGEWGGLCAGLLGSLVFFLWAGLEGVAQHGREWFAPFFPPPSAGTSPVRALFHAAALMFVAYSGHGRIAELSADARAAERTIPRGVVIALITAMVLYLLVGGTALGTVGAEAFARMTLDTAAPLELIAGEFGIPGARELLVTAAVIALLGVLYNLVLGMSRLVAAMGRRLDMPAPLGRANAAGRTSDVAVVATGLLVAAMVFIGDIRVLWEFSAFAALIYYALTNLTAYYLPADKRRYPRVVAAVGLLACLFLAFWVNPAVWVAGLVVIAAGLGWRWAMRRM